MDISFRTGDGTFQFRVGAIIINDSNILLIQHDGDAYYYSVGGRVKMNETTEEAVVREVWEETGQHFEVDRLGFIHENLFTYGRTGERITEIAFFYYMKPSSAAENINQTFREYDAQGNDLGLNERFVWLPLNELNHYTIYPEFFKTELKEQAEPVRHIVQRRA